MFDWSNRVIGFLDPDYAVSASFDAAPGTRRSPGEARRVRPSPGRRTAGCPTRAAAPACRTSTGTRTCSATRSAADPGADVMSILLAQLDEDGGRMSVEEFENMFWLFAVAGQRDAAQRPARAA